MLGLGETEEEIIAVMKDLRTVDCDFLTLGQYMRPTRDNLPVDRYITPEEFQHLGQIGWNLGFKMVHFGTARSQLLSCW